MPAIQRTISSVQDLEGHCEQTNASYIQMVTINPAFFDMITQIIYKPRILILFLDNISN